MTVARSRDSRQVHPPPGPRRRKCLRRRAASSKYPPQVRGGLEQSGLYTVTRRGVAGTETEPAPDHFGVQIDTREGDLAKYSEDELEVALGISLRSVRPDRAREVLQADGGAGGGEEYWRELLIAVLVLLVCESILAALFGRRRR
jgi:hypothetical protein